MKDLMTLSRILHLTEQEARNLPADELKRHHEFANKKIIELEEIHKNLSNNPHNQTYMNKVKDDLDNLNKFLQYGRP